MYAHFKTKLGLCVAMLALAACASKPPHMQTIPETADASAEIESTQSMLNEAKSNNLDVLSPKNYARAADQLGEAREAMVKGKSKEKILDSLARSRGWLEEAQTRGQITQAAVKDLSAARTGAIRATAPTLYPKELKKIDDETSDYAAEAEKGDLAALTKRGDKLTNQYVELEKKSVEKAYLGEAQVNFEAAKKADAKKYSPKTYEATEAKLKAVESMISENPRNINEIMRAANEATMQSKFLLSVNQQTKAGNTEELVLQSEKQRRTIGGMTEGIAAKEEALAKQGATLAEKNATLAQKTAALKTAEELRKTLKPSEADVFVENNSVKVRLKGIQFGSNSAVLNKKSASLLEKVDKVLGTVGARSITVEGHTDSLGSPEKNREVSEKRAEAVQNYIVNQGKISSNQVKAVGMGEESPISDNSTARGRSENRRIDLVIEPQIKAE